MGFLGRGSQPPFHHLGPRVCGGAAGSGAEPRPPNGFHPFEVFRVASPGSLELFIVPCKGRIFSYATFAKALAMKNNRGCCLEAAASVASTDATHKAVFPKFCQTRTFGGCCRETFPGQMPFQTSRHNKHHNKLDWHSLEHTP